jgi:predicted phosphoribosyltransferase
MWDQPRARLFSPVGCRCGEWNMEAKRFRDRREAGRSLVAKLMHYANRPEVLVLALPRGGVPVAFEVASALEAPFDVFLVRKLGVPGHEELAMGAVATGGVRVLNQDVVKPLRIADYVIEAVAAQELEELKRRERLYRGGRSPPDVRRRTVILIDDGLATGTTMRAAIQALRQQQPARIVVAVPTAAPDTCEALKAEADEVICATTPEPFLSVGHWYDDFTQTTDDEVRRLLAQRQPPDDQRPNTVDPTPVEGMRGVAHTLPEPSETKN